MHALFHLPHFAAALLLATTPCAGAETPMTDPIAPAVMGRPLDQIRPAPPLRQKAPAAKPNRAKQVAASNKAGPTRAAAPVPAPALAQAAPAAQHAPKQALDDRVDPNARMASVVGAGTRVSRKALGPGAYFGSKTQERVRRYYEAHPLSGRASTWKIGEPVPKRAAMTGVPDDVRAALPALPPGHQYVQLDGEVVLIAVPSRMVVDGVSRSLR